MRALVCNRRLCSNRNFFCSDDKIVSRFGTERENNRKKLLNLHIANYKNVNYLGLSVRWAACNVGADSPEEYGDYFAWGEITPKDEYTEENAIEIDNDIISITGSEEYDAARAIWGAPWQLPTKVQVEELLEKGEWEWTEMNGCRGCKVTGPNGNSIFLPAAGWIQGSSLLEEGSCGSYWTDERWSHMLDYGEHLYFNGDANYFDNIGMPRFDGASVRPVVGPAE